MRTSADYLAGELVEVAPQYLGAGKFAGDSTTTAYVVGSAGPDDLKLAFSLDRYMAGEWDRIHHLQSIVGSGRCFWAKEC